MSDVTTHTPEPWAVRRDSHGVAIWDGETAAIEDVTSPARFPVASVHQRPGGIDLANARRIVACVNACAGLNTEALEADGLTAVLKAAEESIDNQGHFEPTAARRRLGQALRALDIGGAA